jgi:SAM-dependent methyltransferase
VDESGSVADVITGRLECVKCGAHYPILAGVAVVVEDVREFLLAHVKGIAQVVSDGDLPREYVRELKAAKAELRAEHIEDDLESERVLSLYLMNHFLSAKEKDAWWRPVQGSASPLIDTLVREYWDQGPLSVIQKWVEKLKQPGKVIELGCGVGGLALRFPERIERYLGVDSSFIAIALARHLVLGAPYRGKIRIPQDLLQGPVSRDIVLTPFKQGQQDGKIDFVVGEMEFAPIQAGAWDLSIALNSIDMLDAPASLPALLHKLLKTGGRTIHSCPYIWHEAVARKLRAKLPRETQDSAAAAEWLFTQAGFEIETRSDHVPWLFFKHFRQLEIYSVHLFQAKRQD